MIMRNKNYSFRRHTNKFFIVISILVITFMIFTNSMSIYTRNNYSNILNGYSSIQGYYDAIDEASVKIKTYLTTDTESLLDEYKEEMESAEMNIASLRSNDAFHEKWKVDLLENMLTEYQDVVDQLLESYASEDALDYRPTYNEFVETTSLITSTSSEYYTIMTDSMEENRQIIDLLQSGYLWGSMILLLLMIGSFVYFNHFVRNKVILPIEKILSDIGSIRKGSYSISKSNFNCEEMDAISDAMIEMTDSIVSGYNAIKEKNELEKLLLEQKNESLKKDELLVKSELKMLQNPINPHFLFNTLNTIYRLCLKVGAKDAADMLLNTSHLLRYGLDNQNRISSLENEIHAVKKYIDIQKVRFSGRVDFVLEYEEEDIKGISMPGMILQPLVENALLHGLHDVIDGGEIFIGVSRSEDAVKLIIADNGKGMDPKALEEMMINDFKSQNNRHLGLYNVVRRLRMYFQERMDLSIHSEIDCGFEICITLNLMG